MVVVKARQPETLRFPSLHQIVTRNEAQFEHTFLSHNSLDHDSEGLGDLRRLRANAISSLHCG